jgi:GNAT superfamily N-acetyltransferase
LPAQLFHSDPNWIPRLRLSESQLAGFRRHPFYQAAKSQSFLAFRGSNACGRITAIVNHTHNDWHKERRGFFGFFETVDDAEISTELFDAACQWLREQGMNCARGPANPSINYDWGLLIDGFDTPPYFMMTHNPAYYAPLVEAYGFEKSHDMFAFWGHRGMIDQLSDKGEMLDAAIRERFGVTTRPLNKRRFRQEVEMFLDIYNQALVATWGFIPLSPSEVYHIAGELRQLVVPEISIVAEAQGKPIGCIFGLLNFNPRIRAIGGRLFPFGWIRLLANKRKIKSMRVISANVLPEYQGWGVGISLSRALIDPAQKWGLEEAEFSWVLESNSLSRKSLEKGGVIPYKTYRVYDRAL